MSNNPLVSVIVINYNGSKYLKRCLESLYAGAYRNMEIIFMDNGSIDSSLDLVRSNFGQVKIIENKENLGLSVASNRGASLAKGEYLLFYNNDTVADKDMILNLVKRCETDKDIGICGCRTMTYDGKQIINEGVSCDIFGYPFNGRKFFYVDAAIFIKRSVFDQLGGFDEQMFLYGEDRDLCWRAWLYGHKVAVERSAFFLHDSFCVTEDIKDYRSTVKKRYLGEFNAIRSICKNYSFAFILWILPLFLIINLAEMILFSLILRFDIVWGVYIKAHMQNLKEWPSSALLRKKVQKGRRITDGQLIKHMHAGSGKLNLFFKWGVPKFQ
ncbi:MAG: glycosyltransferase family 2 protein [Candidatus Omnitrophota bacterium]